MKYTKSIIVFLFINLLLVFCMIFIANKTRNIEKKNNYLLNEISKTNKNIKINKIELTIHQNSSYLKKLYSLYYSKNLKYNSPKIVSINDISKNNEIIKLVNANK